MHHTTEYTTGINFIYYLLIFIRRIFVFVSHSLYPIPIFVVITQFFAENVLIFQVPLNPWHGKFNRKLFTFFFYCEWMKYALLPSIVLKNALLSSWLNIFIVYFIGFFIPLCWIIQMSSAERLAIFMEFRIPQFHRFSELGLSSTYHERTSIAFGESNQVSISSGTPRFRIWWCFPTNFRHFLSAFDRYGIRVDPVQWFIVLSGRDEGAGVPSIILLVCKY